MSEIRDHMGSLFKVVESVALLDLLTCFASVVVTAPDPTQYGA